MNTTLSWIKEYVPDLNVGDREFADAMTLSGTKVEFYKRLDANLEKIVVAQILSIEKHPDADKLIVCKCDTGTETLQIVTGASNVAVGDKVPLVLDGGKVAVAHDLSRPEGGVKIKSGKLRGVESFGMMCSIEELGLDKNFYPDAPEHGIYILPADAKLGESVTDLLGLNDTVFEYEITSNRVDCYSVLGIAREAAATFAKKFNPPVLEEIKGEDDINKYLQVEIKSPLCKRYIAKMIKNIRLKPSPAWLRQRLISSGVRPINNIVDITNYVMLEYGQPMHAFDYEKIAKAKIAVDTAKDSEEFTTLDGQIRKLDESILMINDGEKAVAIAGIMGGENSKVSDDISTMVFEAACFDGTNVRLSSKKLGLRTDSSAKFEKDLSPQTALLAIERACNLVKELDAGDIVDGIIDVYPVKQEEVRIDFEFERINKLLGTDISREDMLEYLSRIEIKYDESSNKLIIPDFRTDLHYMADIAEEVARFYGYDKIPTTLPVGESTVGGISYKLKVEETFRYVARFLGYSEAMSYSFESPKVYDKLCIPKDSKERLAIEISNPLGEDYSIMRTSPLNGLLTSLSTNINRRNKNVKLYELANIYLPKELPLKELPDERMQFSLGFYGEGDFFSMKAVVEEMLTTAGLFDRINYDPSCDRPYLHPGRKAEIIYKDVSLGYIGEVHPEVLENYDIKARAYVAVLDMPSINPFTSFDVKYEGIAKYPAISRDISMVVPKNIPVAEIEKIIEKNSGKLLESYELFDIYEGEQIEAGYKSVAYSIVFRDKTRTLEDKEVVAIMEDIIKALESINIKLRM